MSPTLGAGRLKPSRTIAASSSYLVADLGFGLEDGQDGFLGDYMDYVE